MSHVVRGLIAAAPVLGQAAGAFQHAQVRALAQGFALLLLSDEFYDELAATLTDPGQNNRKPYPEIDGLSVSLADLGRRLSLQALIAYVETDYTGGVGKQAALVWERGAVVLGPLVTETWAGSPREAMPFAAGAINQALRRLGVRADAPQDEFDTVGLGRRRSVEDWIDAG